MADWKAGLEDQDELSQYGSAANPLTAMGIDPDEAAADPAMRERFSGRNYDAGAPKPETQKAPPASAVTAGKTAGAGDTPSVPAASLIAPAEPTDEEGYGRQGLGILSQSAKAASQAAGSVPTDAPAELASLTAQREKLALPAARFDPTTGKSLKSTQEYDPASGKMIDVNPQASTGSKVWRGIRGGLMGLATGGIFGAARGAIDPSTTLGGEAYNAPSKQYQRAEQRRGQELGATDTSLENARKNWEEAVKARSAQASEYGKVAALGKDLTTGATGLINAENKPETEANKTNAKLQLSQKEFAQRQQQLQSDPTLSKLSPLNKALYMANGKIPDPREPNEADVTAANIARGIKILGHQPTTLEEWNKVIASAKGDLGKGAGSEQKTEQFFRSIEDKKDIDTKNALEKFATNTTGMTPQQLQGELQVIQNQYEVDMANAGRGGVHNVISVDKNGQVTWTPQAATSTAPTPAPGAPATTPKGPPAGATHTAKSKADGKMHYTNAQGTVDLGVAEP
jgi:hypothetical protein